MVSTAAVNLSDGMVLVTVSGDRNPGPMEASLALTLHRYNGVAKALRRDRLSEQRCRAPSTETRWFGR